MIDEQENYIYKPEELREGLTQIINGVGNGSYKQGYKDGHSIGFVKGVFLGGALVLAVTIGGYSLTKHFSNSNPPEIEQVQPQPTHFQSFTQSELPNRLNEDKELRLK